MYYPAIVKHKRLYYNRAINFALRGFAMPESSSIQDSAVSRFITEQLSRGAFRFSYGGTPSAVLLSQWALTRETVALDERRTRHTLTWSAPDGLAVRCEAIEYTDTAAVEWVLYFHNHGDANTPILDDIQALDVRFPLDSAQACCVRGAKGSICQRDDFAPQRYPLGPDIIDPQYPWVREEAPLTVMSQGGRSSCGALPFFNLDMGEHGVIAAIGWTGDWVARFWREDAGDVHMRAGMQRTHLSLYPGEEIRSPRMLLFFWDGDIVEAHNRFRRLLIDHYSPGRPDEPLQVPITLAVWGENRSERQLEKIQWLTEHAIPVDNFWIDAGWHGNAPYQDGSNVFNSQWWSQVGNWWPNPVTYPDGLGAIGEAAQQAGMRFTLWFEPERVFKDTQFTREHPEWLLGPMGDNYLFNLGDPAARCDLTERISRQIADGHVTCYRQDFNTDPAPFWAAADAPDRVGMSEIRHIEGLYAFWDALLERHPGLLIDNCSSGGRRIDLETNMRSVPLWRSDYQCFPGFDPAGMQGQLQGLAPWVPFNAGCGDHQDTYAFRSAYSPGMTLFTIVNPTTQPEGYLTPGEAFDADWLRQRLTELRAIQPYFAGDFYPLLAYSLADDVWAAWQFNRPDLDEGMLLAFRRPNSPFPQMIARLRGLDAQATYEIRDIDNDETFHASGATLMDDGLPVTIDSLPGSALILYRQV